MTEELTKALSENIVEVTFTKVDGSTRKMVCTKNGEKVPADKTPSGLGTSPKNGVVTVFDLELDAWRSFRPESVIEWKVL